MSGCSIFKLFGPFDIQKVFGLLDIQSFRAARYSNFSGRSTFKVCGLMQSVRAARYSTFSGWSIFKVFGLLDVLTFRAAWYPKLKVVRCSNFSRLPVDIQSFRAARYSNFRGCSVFEIFGPLEIQTFRAARYSKLPGCSIFKLFGPLDIQSFRAARCSNVSARSIFKVFGMLDIQHFGAGRNPAGARFARSGGQPV